VNGERLLIFHRSLFTTDSKIMWFRRTDGVLFCADEGSASFQLMSKSGEFDEVIEIVETENGEKIGLTGRSEMWKDNDEKPESVETDLLKTALKYQDLTDQLRLESENEKLTETQQPALADSQTTGDSGQGSAAVGRAARKSNKAKNSNRT
jgi:hypothetical protein